ncbi:hypothetical protein DM860_009892 [Cuscuta australis]|uniref:Photosystem II 5 kDa protein, chloroplastic n=1 Tax=Cuscuta australis TaxID=267555 RepID=A0A328DD02_9ASTE|nr:hypothetical protein DM860_009892 [Cuscuta australis]
MASMTITPAYFGGSAAVPKGPSALRRGVVPVRASKEASNAASAEEIGKGRRDLVFAAAAAAAWSVVKVAVAEEEPKPGTAEAKKKYAPICVTMPTAKICRKENGESHHHPTVAIAIPPRRRRRPLQKSVLRTHRVSPTAATVESHGHRRRSDGPLHLIDTLQIMVVEGAIRLRALLRGARGTRHVTFPDVVGVAVAGPTALVLAAPEPALGAARAGIGSIVVVFLWS